MMDQVRINVWHNDGTTTITVNGILTMLYAEQFKKELLTASADTDKLILDLREVSFIDTSAMQYIAKAALAMIKRGARLRVLLLSGSYLYRALETAGLAHLFDVYPHNTDPDEYQRQCGDPNFV